ncbi:MAG: ribonuclease HII [Desulfobacteraceae bacterium]|nr:ribonuclease HII [Desulfobacteraceae bacterium]MBC2754660.1 ribonuclease HII [Desulfobacteraceae bacterium]
MWAFEKEARLNGFDAVAGIDEAGRGPLAGPVVSAAVILPDPLPVFGIRDSKKISPKKREKLFDEILRHAIAVGVGIVGPVDIDRLNILQASLLSMAISVQNLDSVPDFLLIDGTFSISFDLPQKAVPKGDSLSISIAAASIVAKVTRDRIMEKYAKEYPEFDFSKHKGYPTKAHKEAIHKHGISPIHRLSFKGVKEYCR